MSSGMDIALLFFYVYHTVLAFTGCILNSLLIHVAIFHSPKTIRSYATLIVNFGITDFVECALDYFLQIRLLPTPWNITFTYILNGACVSFGPTMCYIALSFFLHCIPHAVWSLLLSFAYRYYILFYPAVRRKNLLIILFLVYFPSFIQALTYWTNLVSREEILETVQKSFPTYDFNREKGVITGVTNFLTISAAFTVSQLTLPITPVYIAIFILRRRIIRYLEARTASMSKETRAIHAQLLRVLTIQALIPVFVWIGVFFYFLGQLGIWNNPIIEYLTFGSALILPTISPLSYLLYVRPYRNYCKNVWIKMTCNRSETYSEKDLGKFNTRNSSVGKVGPIAINDQSTSG